MVNNFLGLNYVRMIEGVVVKFGLGEWLVGRVGGFWIEILKNRYKFIYY